MQPPGSPGPQRRTAKRGDRQTKTEVSRVALQNATRDAMRAEDSPTVRQRVAEARRSRFLDLRGLGLSILPEDVWDLDSLEAILLGGNKFSAVPPNLAASFPTLVYIDLSRNNIASIPSNLAELDDLLVLDLSGNPALEGSQVPASFGPIRHRTAVLVDGEAASQRTVEGHKARRAAATAKVSAGDQDGEEDEDGYDDDDDEENGSKGRAYDDDDDENDDDDDDDDTQPRHDLMEDEELQRRRFFRRLDELEDAADLASQFRRLLAARDPLLLKYLHRRHGGGSGDSDEDGAPAGSGPHTRRTREQKEQVEHARREKDRLVDGMRASSRRLKVSRARAADDD
ncbi:hypothetical protein HK405_007399 [Cladochytrium tenue]|nr:hypothetical protein HK405_007399 [Cladochytrium tenue]